MPIQEQKEPIVKEPHELIVIVEPDAQLNITDQEIISLSGMDVNLINRIRKQDGFSFQKLFDINETRLKHKFSSAIDSGVTLPNLSTYHRIQAPDERLREIAEQLREQTIVKAAYVKPPPEPPLLNLMSPRAEAPPPVTPDFSALQGYLDDAPEGISARFSWEQPGGAGQGISIIDIEGAWRFTHEDLVQNQGGVIGGMQSNSLFWRNHGTAVVGVLGGDRGNFGIIGICPDAAVRAISGIGSLTSSEAILMAADALNPGDVILIEIHRAGPRHGFNPRFDQSGYTAVEWWPDDFDAILYATSRGIIVVEAAGNGGENLDDNIYDQSPVGPHTDFGSDWTNPFNRNNRDSGAIIVGAGAPPSGNHGPDRSRLPNSNYGDIVDVQGWGSEVVTTGYGDLQGGSQDEWYTRDFKGTSSAAAIVAGAIANLQGIVRACGKPPLPPAEVRNLLRNTGSTQQDANGRPATQRIGNRPDLREMVNQVCP